MKASTLPRPGVFSVAERLRVLAAEAISDIEIAEAKTGDLSNGDELAAFFTACAAATPVTPDPET